MIKLFIELKSEEKKFLGCVWEHDLDNENERLINLAKQIKLKLIKSNLKVKDIKVIHLDHGNNIDKEC